MKQSMTGDTISVSGTSFASDITFRCVVPAFPFSNQGGPIEYPGGGAKMTLICTKKTVSHTRCVTLRR